MPNQQNKQQLQSQKVNQKFFDSQKLARQKNYHQVAQEALTAALRGEVDFSKMADVADFLQRHEISAADDYRQFNYALAEELDCSESQKKQQRALLKNADAATLMLLTFVILSQVSAVEAKQTKDKERPTSELDQQVSKLQLRMALDDHTKNFFRNSDAKSKTKQVEIAQSLGELKSNVKKEIGRIAKEGSQSERLLSECFEKVDKVWLLDELWSQQNIKQGGFEMYGGYYHSTRNELNIIGHFAGKKIGPTILHECLHVWQIHNEVQYNSRELDVCAFDINRFLQRAVQCFNRDNVDCRRYYEFAQEYGERQVIGACNEYKINSAGEFTISNGALRRDIVAKVIYDAGKNLCFLEPVKLVDKKTKEEFALSQEQQQEANMLLNLKEVQRREIIDRTYGFTQSAAHRQKSDLEMHAGFVDKLPEEVLVGICTADKFVKSALSMPATKVKVESFKPTKSESEVGREDL